MILKDFEDIEETKTWQGWWTVRQLVKAWMLCPVGQILKIVVNYWSISTFDNNKRCCPDWISYEDGHVHLPDVADTGLAVLAVLGVFKAASIVPGCFAFCGCCFGITLLSRLFTTIVVFFKVILITPGRPASLPGLLTCGFLNHRLTIFIFSK